jgi:4-amino-4-deoxy-L-arabinose transferase-like glycosyltransferase
MAGIPIAMMWWPRRRRWPASPGLLALAALALLLLGGGWFVAIYARMGAEPLVHFFFKENLERFAGEAYDVGRPFWYYPPAYLLAGLPWSLLLAPALRRVSRGDGSALLAAWTLVALVPLSLSRGKLDYYLLPLYPAIALLVARWLTSVSWDTVDRGWSRGASLVAAAGFAALALLPGRFDTGWLPGPGACRLFVAMAVVAALGSLRVALWPSPRGLCLAFAAGSAAMGLVLAGLFLPAFRAGQPNAALAEDVRRERQFRPTARVVACADPARVERDVLFAARVTVERRCDLWNVAPSREPFLFLLRPEEHRSLEAIPGFREVARYRYLPAATLTLAGFLEPKGAGLVVLGANFDTSDPVAEARRRKTRKRTLREQEE